MPKVTKYPKLRAYVKRGKGGQVWRSWSYDMRGTGEPDIALGNDYAEALRRWDEIHNERPRIRGTLEEAFKAWESGVLPAYASAETKKGYTKSLKRLRPVFGPSTWDAITFKVLKDYLAKRSAKTQANRELALLSVIWNWARGEGLTELQWPAAGMSRSRWKNPERAREVDYTEAMFQAIYAHADQVLRDAMDIASATGLRVRDTITVALPPVDAPLKARAGKTGKWVEFDVTASSVLPALIERRRASKAPHLFLLTAGTRIVTERMLHDRFVAARAAAVKETPEVAGLFLRDLRKHAAQLAGGLEEASRLLQHSGEAVTRRHYRQGEKVKPVR